MFDLDRWREIFQSIRKNKLRSILSGFTVAFAILLFTLLFGIVTGLQNQFKTAFVDDAQNAIFVRVWKTSKPYKGLQAGRKVQLENKDFDFVKKEYKNKIQYLTARIYKNVNISFGRNKNNYSLRAVHPDHQFLEKTIIDEGRYINDLDLQRKLKVVVIGRLIKKDLFGGKPALGKRININGILYKVVGVFSDEGGDNEERIAYMPVTTAQRLYGNSEYIDQINIGYDPKLSLSEAVILGNRMEKELRSKLDIHPDDQSALSVHNLAEANQGINQFMLALYFIVIFVGSGTLIAGIIGISNIMIFVIKERTKEFGIRKALGAQPASIIGMVIQESILITALSGYIGLSIGTYILSAIGDSLEEFFIKDPSVSPRIVIIATIILILSGLIAGYLPAKKAAQIKPIVALRAD
ncbi:ABC transporter permease [Tenacibaculum sp. C7A-26P2]|uniref:ABC transporter permease n=1 Tax=Tenacibaculum sp. C7A-26P2 TaxID=3447504 RepID=UPI003F879C94